MDTSRSSDIRYLKSRFEDVRQPLWVRQSTRRAFVNIQRQTKDKTLTKLRLRLVKAHRKSDVPVILKLESVIGEHNRRHKYNF